MALNKYRLTDELLAKIVENDPFYFAIYDADRRLIHLNKTALQALGKDLAEFFGCKDEDFLPQEITSQYLATFKRVQETKKPAKTELNIRRHDNIIIKELNYVPLLDAAGNLNYILTYAYEISRVKKSENALAAEEKRLHTEDRLFVHLMKNAQEGIIVAEKPFRIMAVSQYAIDTTELLWEDYCTDNFKEFSQKFKLSELDKSLVSEQNHPVLKALTTGEATINQQYSLRNKSGEYRSIIMSSIAIKDEKGEITGVLVSWRDITEMKGLEALYLNLFDHSSDSILLLNFASRTYIDCNFSWERLSGYTKAEVMDKEFGFFTPDALKPRLTEFAQKMRTPAEQKFEWQIRKKSGEILSVEITGSLIHIEGRTYFQALIREISARKKQEEQLRESEEWYRAFFESSSDGIVFTDIEGNILEVNPTYCQMLGYSEAELKEMTYRDTNAPQSQELDLQMMHKLLRTGEPGAYEKFLRKRDGSLIPVEVKSWVKKNERGEITGLWKINRDITKRRKAEEALRKSELRYRTIYEGSNDAIAIIRLEGLKFVDFNSKFTELTGYTKAELPGKVTVWFMTPEHLHSKIAEVAAELKTKKALIHDWELLTKTGEVIPVQFSSKVVEIEGINYIYSIARDMRLIKQAQEVLKRDNDALEKIVKERTAALTQAQRLSDLGTALATITHELKNPIMAIDLAAYNIKRKTKEEAIIGKQLEIIRKKVQESNRIIEDVLAYIRIRPPKLQEVSLRALINECEHLARSRHPGTTIKLINVYGMDEALMLKIDPVQITEVLNNLLNNAYDALASSETHRQNGIIEVNTQPKNQEIIIIIKDNGPGFAPGAKEKLFEPFFTTKSQGTGLGLATSKRIIENHGGEIHIESADDKGTTVTLTLPRLV